MTIHASADNAVLLSVMAMDASCQLDPGQTGSRIVDLAVKLIPCAAADIVRVTAAGRVGVTSSSDPSLSEASEAVCHLWPHPLALGTDGDANRPPEHSDEYFRRLRDDCGVAQEWDFSLSVGPAAHGYLRFLFREEPDAAAETRKLAGSFAAHAALALDRSVLRAQVASLLTAMESNREIGVAIGVLMARRSITYPQAFALLKSSSQNHNRKLREVAAEVLYTGELPAEPPGRTPARLPRPAADRPSADGRPGVGHATHFRPRG